MVEICATLYSFLADLEYFLVSFDNASIDTTISCVVFVYLMLI